LSGRHAGRCQVAFPWSCHWEIDSTKDLARSRDNLNRHLSCGAHTLTPKNGKPTHTHVLDPITKLQWLRLSHDDNATDDNMGIPKNVRARIWFCECLSRIFLLVLFDFIFAKATNNRQPIRKAKIWLTVAVLNFGSQPRHGFIAV